MVELLRDFLNEALYPILVLGTGAVITGVLTRSNRKSRQQDSDDHARVIAAVENNTALTSKLYGEFEGFRREHAQVHERIDADLRSRH